MLLGWLEVDKFSKFLINFWDFSTSIISCMIKKEESIGLYQKTPIENQDNFTDLKIKKEILKVKIE